ncbi:hypothetical protein 7S3_44 [uncultured Caudovirales phage]|uniref:Uncharacterized protein n=1 Tax=uncultured Caudovirales phage TaxID=2100421 RepID=A0A2H4J2B8_9CAUD|nr:hypothetical protein 7S3_44 [uncultured Caudovirales phage]
MSLADQLDPTTPAYVNARLLELEQHFQRAPRLLEQARDALTVARARLRREEAKARIDADGRSADVRDAQVSQATESAREGVEVADAAFKYLQDRVQQWSREKDALQTRSANLRAEMQLGAR